MIGKKKNGEAEVIDNREIYPNEAVEQCLNSREIKLIKDHFSGLGKLEEASLDNYRAHIEGCCDCQGRVGKEIGFAHFAVQKAGLEDESLHTSAPPEQACMPFCKTHHKVTPKLKDILNWSDIRVH